MGLKISKQRRNRGSRGESSSNINGMSGLSNADHLRYYTPQHHHAPARRHFRPLTPPHRCKSSYDYQQPCSRQERNFDSKYSRIADNYQTLDQVTAALTAAGLESSNLIVGIDFTKSNEWTGTRSFNRQSLHHLGNVQNPYEEAISIIGQTLSAFDEDNLIPCFGFGDASTHDRDVFSFYPNHAYCNGFEDVLRRYREIVPHLKLSGPTSFAPMIEMAMTIVEESCGQYHVLLIIADGQVTKSMDTRDGQLSPQEKKTIDAIVIASAYPLSIIMVGVGDGPWDTMRVFDDNLPARAFDNFQFVNFTEIMSKNINPRKRQTEFALAALMEIPSQYKATIELNILGRQSINYPQRIPLPTPLYDASSFSSGSKPYPLRSFHQSTPVHPMQNVSAQTAASSGSLNDNQLCVICLVNVKDMAFGCGHQTCCECGVDLQSCPICRRLIKTRIKLFS
ncbi:E3 ubiquitin-protein ligase RGLG1 [Apium graveolens]|uniref:E3 ubiquitin-protein ligase RGLG1 n=1 Tax=Apium graveolens TaxID=4045 RepID=UPI003D7B2F80